MGEWEHQWNSVFYFSFSFGRVSQRSSCFLWPFMYIWLETQRCVSSQVYFKPFWKEESNAAPGHSLHLYLSLRRKKLMSISSFFIQISVPPSNYLSVCLSVSLSFDQLLLLTPTSPAPSTSYFLILQVFQDWWQTSQNNSSKKKKTIL